MRNNGQSVGLEKRGEIICKLFWNEIELVLKKHTEHMRQIYNYSPELANALFTRVEF
jgi:hypothetical protein